MGIGRAIQLGYLTMEDLQRPAVQLLNKLDLNILTEGAEHVTLHEALHMSSGIRLDPEKAKKLRSQPALLKGQGQIQSYLEHSAPIPAAPRDYKYQAADPAIAMQVLEAVVPGGAKAFLRKELLAPLGFDNYHWQKDTSGFPKSAAGSSFRSRDMLKMGMLILQDGEWDGQQHLPVEFIRVATSPLKHAYGKAHYGYFWWTEDFDVAGKTYHCIEGRGAGGQFIFIFPDLELIVVATAHNQGMGKMLQELPHRLIPAFAPQSFQN